MGTNTLNRARFIVALVALLALGAAVITDLYAATGAQSVAIAGAADIVQAFSGYDAGIWSLSGWMSIPAEFVGETYFIVLNTYVPNGDQNWSVQVRFSNGLVASDLFANGADPVYYDDILLISDVVATQSMSLSAIKALFR